MGRTGRLRWMHPNFAHPDCSQSLSNGRHKGQRRFDFTPARNDTGQGSLPGPRCSRGVYFSTWGTERSRQRPRGLQFLLQVTTTIGVVPAPAVRIAGPADSGAGTAFPATSVVECARTTQHRPVAERRAKPTTGTPTAYTNLSPESAESVFGPPRQYALDFWTPSRLAELDLPPRKGAIWRRAGYSAGRSVTRASVFFSA
ncbi:hypothetical protein VT84_23865 [Gemmata sp. SH-PL17]|nr:hypothetical protein VT84_23865 [Gemmata sp. SH-PL17]